MKEILVVDDEPRIADICRDYLQRAGFKVTTAGNGVDGLAIARSSRPDLIVLDLGLPKMDGLDVTRALRKFANVPIIMLTARVEESDKVVGLELGADDYLTKPFSPRELVARVRAVFRRTDVQPGHADVIRASDVVVDVPRGIGRAVHQIHARVRTSLEQRDGSGRSSRRRRLRCPRQFLRTAADACTRALVQHDGGAAAGRRSHPPQPDDRHRARTADTRDHPSGPPRRHHRWSL
jgi:DNA-binding response OmpR family regulator